MPVKQLSNSPLQNLRNEVRDLPVEFEQIDCLEEVVISLDNRAGQDLPIESIMPFFEVFFGVFFEAPKVGWIRKAGGNEKHYHVMPFQRQVGNLRLEVGMREYSRLLDIEMREQENIPVRVNRQLLSCFGLCDDFEDARSNLKEIVNSVPPHLFKGHKILQRSIIPYIQVKLAQRGYTVFEPAINLVSNWRSRTEFRGIRRKPF